MARLVFAYPIEELHGKIKDKFGAAQRKVANQKGERFAYSVNYGTRSTAFSTAELSRQATFKAVAALVAARKTNSAKIADDKAAAKAAGKTYNAYLWVVCKQQYLEEIS